MQYTYSAHTLTNDTHTAHTLIVEINKLEEFDWHCLAFLGKLEIRSFFFFKKFPNFFQCRHTKQTSKDAYTIVVMPKIGRATLKCDRPTWRHMHIQTNAWTNFVFKTPEVHEHL